MPITGRARAGATAEGELDAGGMAVARERRLAVSFNSSTRRVDRMRFHGPAGFATAAKETP
jgi:hypothetical protein